MIKLKKTFVIMLTTILLLFVTAGGGVAFAEEVQETPTVTEEAANIQSVADQFVIYLKDKYGDDYEQYYNAIIEQWGSIEGYLLAFGNKLPEQYQTGWDKFVKWLNDYAVVWATALALVVLIISIIIGKSKLKRLKEWLGSLVEKLVNRRLAPIENELNLQSKATVTLLHAQKTLLGTSEKFAENVAELEKAEKELNNG